MTTSHTEHEEDSGAHSKLGSPKRKRRSMALGALGVVLARKRLLMALGALGIGVALVLWASLYRKLAVVRLVEHHGGDLIKNSFERNTPSWLRRVEEAIGPFPAFDSVTSVEIISPDLTDDDLRVFLDTPDLSHLLLLSSPQISDDGLRHLRNLLGLAELTLHSDRITDAGLRHLAELINLRSLMQVTLHSDRITDAGLRHLAELKRLEYLKVYSKNIDGSGLRHLTVLNGLSWLSLHCPSLRDEHLKLVSKLSLEGLSLAGTHIADEGLVHLHSMKKLRELCVSGTKVTDAGVQRLKRAIPILNLYEVELPVKPPRYTLDIFAELDRKAREQERNE